MFLFPHRHDHHAQSHMFRFTKLVNFQPLAPMTSRMSMSSGVASPSSEHTIILTKNLVNFNSPKAICFIPNFQKYTQNLKNMPSVASAPVTKRPTPAYKKAATVAGGPARKTAGKQYNATAAAAKKTPPVPQAMNGVSPFEIMAARIANRVAEMAETVTFVERQP